MFKKIFFLLAGILWFFSSVYSQNCDCYIQSADTFPLAPMGLGTDTGSAPYYRCNNCSSLPIKLPFTFCFYGKNYDTVYINNKGSLSFIHPDFDYSSTGLPAGNDTLLLDVFPANIDNRYSNSFSGIYYQITPTHVIVQWSTMGYNTFDDDLYDNFQITITNGNDTILPPGNNVSYCYWLMQWASADSSGGSNGFGGIPTSVGVNKGDHVHYAQIGEFNYPGAAYGGPSNPNGGVYWLINKSFIFNTCVNGNTIPPMLIQQSSCDSVILCAGDTATFTVSFLCAQQGQKATLLTNSQGLSGLTTTLTNANSIYSAGMKLIAAVKDTGIHSIHIVATDNSSPSLKDSMEYVVVIHNCNKDTTTGISRITGDKENFNIYPDPNGGIFTLQASVVSRQSSVEVYNMLGEKVYSHYQISPASNYQIDLSSQPAGMYFYLIKDRDGNLLGNGKFVITR